VILMSDDFAGLPFSVRKVTLQRLDSNLPIDKGQAGT